MLNRRTTLGLSALATTAVVLVGASLAAAAVRTPSGSGRATAQYRFRVVAATHSSSASKTDLPFYTGSSTSSWRLAAPTKRAPNVIEVGVTPQIIVGAGMVNIRGVFTAQAQTQNDQCTLSAPTGTREYPAVAPAAFMMAIGQDPKSKARALIAMDGNARTASVGNPYFGTGCSTSLTGQPDADQTNLIRVPRTIFRKSIITLRTSGTSSEGGIAYRWSTTITLKKIVKKK